METHFHQELNHFKKKLLKMAGLVEQAIASAIDALVKRDSFLAERTIREEKAIFGVIFGVSELAHNLHFKKIRYSTIPCILL